jgi:2-amino-4-hydroxy-6-hydroxymethyldihydropteridine diphosphokinase
MNIAEGSVLTSALSNEIATIPQGARTIDIDILYFESQLINTLGLSIPHDRIPIRRFVLVPLSELIPDFIDPKTNKSIVEMLNDCQDTLEVAVYEKN